MKTVLCGTLQYGGHVSLGVSNRTFYATVPPQGSHDAEIKNQVCNA